MTTFIKLSLVSLMTFSLSCDTAKSAATNTEKDTENTIVEDSKKMESKNLSTEGYSLGTIAYTKDSKCNYIIVDEKSGAKFDPINIDDKKYASLKSDATKVYYKYRPLRMMNRCDEAQPIELEDMQSR